MAAYEFIDWNGQLVLDLTVDSRILASEQDAVDVVGLCGEGGTHRLLLSDANLPPEFYDLRTGLAGAVLQKFVTYSVRFAFVLPKEKLGNGRFYEMVIEANRGCTFHVYQDRASALNWLTC